MLLALCAPIAAGAQDFSSCPAPVVEGPWSATNLPGTVVKAFNNVGGIVMSVPAAKGTQMGTIEVPSCGPEFIYRATAQDGTRLQWLLQPEVWDGEQGAQYSGIATIGGMMTFKLNWTIGNPYEAYGVNEITLSDGRTMAFGAPAALLRAMAQPRRRYECRCVEHLQKWIDERIEETERFQAAYQNPEYRQRPPEVPPEELGKARKWTTSLYADIVATIVGNGVSYQEAVNHVVDAKFPKEALDSEGFDSGDTEGNAEGGTEVDTGTVTAGGVNLKTCEVTYSDSYKQRCYPALNLESTVVHEGVHVATCKSNRLAPFPGVEGFADDEVAAHQAEIDFLKNFIPKNCK